MACAGPRRRNAQADQARQGQATRNAAYELFNELKAKEPEQIVEGLANLTVFEAFKPVPRLVPQSPEAGDGGTGPPFSPIVRRSTGEIRTFTAADLKDCYWELDGKTTCRTGNKRCVYLTPGMIELCRELAEADPTGPLFLNTRGKPWTRNAIRIRFRNLRKRLGLPAGVVAYAFRDSWITDVLERRVLG